MNQTRKYRNLPIMITVLFFSSFSIGIQTIDSGRHLLLSSGSLKCNEEVKKALTEGWRERRYRRETQKGAPWEVLEDVWQRIEAEKAQQERKNIQQIPNIFSRRKRIKKRRKSRDVPTTIVRPLRSAPGVDAFVNNISIGPIEASSPSGCTFEIGDLAIPKAKVTIVFGKIIGNGKMQLTGRLHATESDNFTKGNIVYAECNMNAWVGDLVVTIYVYPITGHKREVAQPRGMDRGKGKWPLNNIRNNYAVQLGNVNLKMKFDAFVSGRPETQFQGCNEVIHLLRRKWESELKLNGNNDSGTLGLALLQGEVEDLFFNALKHAAIRYLEKTIFRVVSSNLALKMGYTLSYG